MFELFPGIKMATSIPDSDEGMSVLESDGRSESQYDRCTTKGAGDPS
jgi:hypothetical protein